MAWSDWRDAVWPSAPDSDTPRRRPAHQPGTSHDGYTVDRPPPRDRPRPEPAERPSSWEPVDVPDPDGMRRSPGAQVTESMTPRSCEERNQ